MNSLHDFGLEQEALKLSNSHHGTIPHGKIFQTKAKNKRSTIAIPICNYGYSPQEITTKHVKDTPQPWYLRNTVPHARLKHSHIPNSVPPGTRGRSRLRPEVVVMASFEELIVVGNWLAQQFAACIGFPGAETRGRRTQTARLSVGIIKQ